MIAKRHIQRLERMLDHLDAKERMLQIRCGDRVAGSMRSSDWRDAEALRAALGAIKAAMEAKEGGNG